MKKVFWATAIAATALLSACNNRPTSANLKSEADTLSYEIGMVDAPSEADLVRYISDPRVGSDSTYLDEFLKGFADGMTAAKDKKTAAYTAGLQAGAQMRTQLTQIEQMVYAGDSTKRLSVQNYLAGFNHGVSGKKTALMVDGKPVDKMKAGELANEKIRQMMEAALAKQHAAEKQSADSFMTAKAKEAGVQKLPGGTLYKVLKAGDGPKAKLGETVNVVYEGRLMNGLVFDASSKHPGPDGTTIPMVVGNSIPGFDEALKAMPVGSEWEVYIPYDQGYGAQGGGPFPPFSVLIFKVTAVSIGR